VLAVNAHGDTCVSRAGRNHSTNINANNSRGTDHMIESSTIPHVLQLGRWSVAAINEMIVAARVLCPTASERCMFWATRFYGTPFFFESNLPECQNQVRIRLETFDCITYLYTVIALADATDFNDFVTRLVTLRYMESGESVAPDPPGLAMLHFTEEALLERAVTAGYVRDVTQEVATGPLKTVSARLLGFKRPKSYDSNEAEVRPLFGERSIHREVISSSDIPEHDRGRFRAGDIILFTKGDRPLHDGRPNPLLINHAGFCDVENDRLHLLHSTRSFAWNEDAGPHTLPRHTGLYLDGDIKKELIGVGFAGQVPPNEIKTKVGQLSYYGYDQSVKRSLRDYASNLFDGIVVLRCCDAR
jgi:hypothetical protein